MARSKNEVHINVRPIETIAWTITSGAVDYVISDTGDIYRPLKKYVRGNKGYYNIVVNGKLRRISQTEINNRIQAMACTRQ